MEIRLFIFSLLLVTAVHPGKKARIQRRGVSNFRHVEQLRRNQAHNSGKLPTTLSIGRSSHFNFQTASGIAILCLLMAQPILATQCSFEKGMQGERTVFRGQCSRDFACQANGETIHCSRACDPMDEDCCYDRKSCTFTCPSEGECKASGRGFTCFKRGDDHFCSDNAVYMTIQ